MRDFNREITFPTIALLLGLAGAFLLLSACGTPHHPKPSSPKAPKFSVSKRCRTIGTAAGQYVTMAAQRNCLKNGVTTVAIMVLYPKQDKPTEIAEETVKLLITMLGFKPKLALLTMGRAKGKPFYIFIVTGEADG